MQFIRRSCSRFNTPNSVRLAIEVYSRSSRLRKCTTELDAGLWILKNLFQSRRNFSFHLASSRVIGTTLPGT